MSGRVDGSLEGVSGRISQKICMMLGREIIEKGAE